MNRFIYWITSLLVCSYKNNCDQNCTLPIAFVSTNQLLSILIPLFHQETIDIFGSFGLKFIELILESINLFERYSDFPLDMPQLMYLILLETNLALILFLNNRILMPPPHHLLFPRQGLFYLPRQHHIIQPRLFNSLLLLLMCQHMFVFHRSC